MPKAACAFFALSVLGCRPQGGVLSGSVGELFSLQVSRIELSRNEEAFQVTYLFNRAAELDVVVRITVALKGVDFSPGKRISLDGEYEPGHARTTVVRVPGGEPARRFPPVKKGDLNLGSGGGADEPTDGDFSMVFDSTGGDIGQGRTLVGSFAGTPVDAGF
ncbi:MAG: hypothetical protein HYZ28_28185 [Myxococcales bacterium]|nr:hypothetical protein [Myxococcales bacterium]